MAGALSGRCSSGCRTRLGTWTAQRTRQTMAFSKIPSPPPKTSSSGGRWGFRIWRWEGGVAWCRGKSCWFAPSQLLRLAPGERGGRTPRAYTRHPSAGKMGHHGAPIALGGANWGIVIYSPKCAGEGLVLPLCTLKTSGLFSIRPESFLSGGDLRAGEVQNKQNYKHTETPI